MNEKEQEKYYIYTIKNDLRFKNRVLEYKICKYQELISILIEYADGCWLYKNDYGEQYGEDEDHNDEEYVSEEVVVDKLYDDIDKCEEELLHIQLKEMIEKQKQITDRNIKRKQSQRKSKVI